MQLSSSTVIDGKYQVVRQLGEGGMGAVYEARHTGTGRRVAVKVIAGASLSKNPEVLRRFQREAMASGAIESQYIAQILDTGVDPATGSPYTVMELLQGEDLEHAVHRLGPLPPDLAMRIAVQACLGLRRAHESSVVHRDIKPANLFLARREEGDRVVKLLDFGIAKVKAEQTDAPASGGLTRTGAMLGSPLYMSPEQARGKKDIDHRTDIWSLGVVLYEMLAGAPPHGHIDTVGELILQICSAPPRPVQELAAWVAPDVANIVHRALALDPEQRFASAGEMADALRAQLPGGIGLTEPMFVAMTEQARAMSAPKMALTSGMRAPAPSFAGAPHAAAVSGPVGSSTTVGVNTSNVVDRPKSRAVVVVSVALAMAGVGALAAWKFAANRTPTAASVPAAPPLPSVVPSATPASVVLPPIASAQVDSANAPEDAAVPLTRPSSAVTPPRTVPRPAVSVPPPATTSTSSMHMDMK